jgi:hypothetical protein
MPYKFIIVKPDGKISCETHNKLPDWKELQKYVEGPFQVCPYFSSVTLDGTKYSRGTAYCHEEGKLKGLPFNPLASAMWLKACPKGDPNRMVLVGTVLFVVKVKEVEEHAKAS